MIISWNLNKRAAVRVAKRTLHRFAVEIRQDVKEIADIEPDIQRVPIIFELQVFLRLLLLAVAANDAKIA
jgi:hypothetical protein